MIKNILIYMPNTTLGFHFETELELIQKHLDKGDNITIISCDKKLKKSYYFSCLGVGKCYYCKKRREIGIASLTPIRSDQIHIKELPDIESKSDGFTAVNSISDVRNFKYKGVDTGLSTLSTLISLHRKPYLEFNKYKKEIMSSLRVTKGLVDFMEAELKDKSYDLMYFFNGRFNIYRPLLRVAQKFDIPFYTHERGSSIQKYSLYKNTYPHDLEYIKGKILKEWADNSDVDREGQAEGWFENRRKGDIQAWHSFIDKSSIGKLPEIVKSKEVITIFPSSQDEFEAVEGWANFLFQSQNDGIESILNNYKDDDTKLFIIRVHPNLSGISNEQTKKLQEFSKYKNCLYMAADEKVDSYSLIEISQKIITFGSTVGVEATYWGKPSILVGRSVYEDLNCTHNPKTIADLYALINNKALSVSENFKESALKFSFYYSNFGEPFKYFKPASLTTGLFNGRAIRPPKHVTYMVGFFWYIYNLKFVLSGEMSLKLLINKLKNNLTKAR